MEIDFQIFPASEGWRSVARDKEVNLCGVVTVAGVNDLTAKGI